MSKRIIFGIDDKILRWTSGEQHPTQINNTNGKINLREVITGICEHDGDFYVSKLGGSIFKGEALEKINFKLHKNEKLYGLASHQGRLLAVSEFSVPTGVSYETASQTIDTYWYGFGIYDVQKNTKISAELSVRNSDLLQRPGELSIYGDVNRLFIGSQNFMEVSIAKKDLFGVQQTVVEFEKVTDSICDHPIAGVIGGALQIVSQKDLGGLTEAEYPVAICKDSDGVLLRTKQQCGNFRNFEYVERFYETDSNLQLGKKLFEHKYKSSFMSIGSKPTIMTYLK
jgi:hypothetical protein